MKKCFVSLLAAAVLLTLLSACAGGGTFREQAYASGAEQVRSISVQVTDRAVELCASADGQVHISYFDSEKEYLDISLSDGALTVTLQQDKEWTDFIGTQPDAAYRKITLEVPADVSSVSVQTRNEDISLSSLSVAESVLLDVNGGSIRCEGVDAGKAIGLKAKNGDVTGSIVGGWSDFSIACTIKKGECNLPESKEGGEKSLTVDCNNGNIDLAFTEA